MLIQDWPHCCSGFIRMRGKRRLHTDALRPAVAGPSFAASRGRLRSELPQGELVVLDVMRAPRNTT